MRIVHGPVEYRRRLTREDRASHGGWRFALVAFYTFMTGILIGVLMNEFSGGDRRMAAASTGGEERAVTGLRPARDMPAGMPHLPGITDLDSDMTGEAPAWQRYAAAAVPPDGRPRIAIIMDDLGLSSERTAQVIALPGPLTLSFLPYGTGLAGHVARARANGHEVMAHVPMEPDGRADPGPEALYAALDQAEFAYRFSWNLSRVPQSVGFNNHMGSRLTRDANAMARLMTETAARGLLFVDSVTSEDSIAYDIARAYNVPALRRDIFIDHLRDADFIRSQLAALERLARQRGHAVAIAHPYPETIDILREWLEEAEARGFVLVPVSALAGEAQRGPAEVRAEAG
jgi:polysaccharide deacetylase 2 family uncharacterized protein YibQ